MVEWKGFNWVFTSFLFRLYLLFKYAKWIEKQIRWYSGEFEISLSLLCFFSYFSSFNDRTVFLPQFPRQILSQNNNRNPWHKPTSTTDATRIPESDLRTHASTRSHLHTHRPRIVLRGMSAVNNSFGLVDLDGLASSASNSTYRLGSSFLSPISTVLIILNLFSTQIKVIELNLVRISHMSTEFIIKLWNTNERWWTI